MQDSLRWFNYFLDMALLSARMSKDPSTIVGAVIVGPDREVRATGFNGFPRGIADTPARLENREEKLRLVVHAECNAICNAARAGVSVKGCTLYLVASDRSGDVWGGPPCTRCTVHVIQAGITRVVTRPIRSVPSRWHEDIATARKLLDEAGIDYVEVPHQEGDRLQGREAAFVEALQLADKAMAAAVACVRNEIGVREMAGRDTGVWPDVLTGCVSGNGLEEALGTVAGVLAAAKATGETAT